MNPSTIKRGVSLYSYQEEFFLRKMNLEDCIRVSARMGAMGIETLAEQMMPGFPNLPDGFYARWHEWMEQYGTAATCHDLFLDTMRYQGRLLSLEEQAESVLRDIKHAHRLGCSSIRVLMFVEPELLERCVGYAEEYDIKLGLEIHAPLHLDHPWVLRHLESMDRIGSDHLGIIPDMGIFTRRLPRVQTERMIRLGATPHIVEHISQAYENSVLSEYIIRDVRLMGGNALDVATAETTRHTVWSSPKRMLEHMPRILHIHAKFYEMLDSGLEYSIPYEQIIPILQKGGYSSYLSSEYEGNRHIQDAFEVDSVEQVKRQQEMFARLLGEENARP